MLELSLSGKGTLQTQVYEALRDAVIAGHVQAAERLPSSRSLAVLLGVSRMTTKLAYDRLIERGFAVVHPRSGVFAADGVSMAAPKMSAPQWRGAISRYGRRLANLTQSMRPYHPERHGLIDFSYLHAVSTQASQRAWRRAVRQTLHSQSDDYPESLGLYRLRRSICAYLAHRHRMVCAPGQIMIVSGMQQALNLCAQLLIDAGDPVMLEEPGYPQARFVFEQAGARLTAVAVDRDGARFDAAVIRRLMPRLIYTTSAHQFPLGGILPPIRRTELLRAASTSGAWILEDDYDGEFRHQGTLVESLRTMDTHDCVIHVGTFSKTLTPSLRLAYMVLPEAVVDLFSQARLLQDQGMSTLTQAALAEFIEAGSYEKHITQSRKLIRSRSEVVLSELRRRFADRITISGSGTGSFIVVWLNEFTAEDIPRLQQAMLRRRVFAYGVDRYYLNETPGAGFLLGYGHLEESDLAAGVERFLHAVTDSAVETRA